jgi:hypothetical protein
VFISEFIVHEHLILVNKPGSYRLPGAHTITRRRMAAEIEARQSISALHRVVDFAPIADDSFLTEPDGSACS